MTHECTCKTCGKKFQSQNKYSTVCYDCALAELIGNGGPEEGDINSALLISGEMTDDQARWLEEDLESVEQGRSIREFEDNATDVCEICGNDQPLCSCPYRYND